jgi:hypothetical protein
MMLERDRVDDLDGVGRGLGQRAEEYTVDGLMGVFEGMKDDFSVREVGESKGWARHSTKAGAVWGASSWGI